MNQGQDDNSGSQIERFGARLAYLVKVPSVRIGEFLGSSALELEQQLAVIDDISGRLEAIRLALRQDPGQGLEAFNRLDLRIISRDHGWREILSNEELRHADGLPFLEVALEKYIEYLTFRRKLLEFILQRRAVLQADSGPRQGALLSTLQDLSKKETSAFDRPARDLNGMASDLYRRLPGRETVRLELGEDAVLTLMLAGHVFAVSRLGEELRIRDENGLTYLLPAGSHSLGRSRRCDVMLDPNFREISRKHLVIEWDGADGLSLLDLSQLGTFIRRTGPA